MESSFRQWLPCAFCIITRDGLIGGAMLTQPTFEQGEAINLEQRASHRGVASQEGIDQSPGPAESGKGDMGQIGAVFRRQANGNTGAVDFAMQRRQRIARFYSDPERIDHAPAVERADAGQLDIERGEADGRQRVGDVVGAMAINLTDEA